MGEPVDTPWAQGHVDARGARPELLFGAMFEDWTIEAELFRPGSRIFAIASAGCTSLALASRGMAVVAVDVNRMQVEYVAARLAGAPIAGGAIDRKLARLRRALRWIGPRESEIHVFLAMADPVEQRRLFRQHASRPLPRALLRAVLDPLVLRFAYAPQFLRALPPRFDRIVLQRLERGFATHPNRTNPYAWRLLTGSVAPPVGQDQEAHAAAEVRVVVADAADFLERSPPASFDGFTLSNILDGASDEYRHRLFAAIARAAAPGATVVLRSFGEPWTEEARHLAIRDRALLWGRIDVTRF